MIKTIISIAMMIVLLIGPGLTKENKPVSQITPDTGQKNVSFPTDNPNPNIYTVSSVFQSPDKFTTEFELIGVVSLVNSRKNQLVVIDTTEYIECNSISCADEQIPVQWSGVMPKLRDYVQLQGNIKKTRTGYLFIAKKLDIIKPK